MSHYRVGVNAHRRYSQFAILDQDGQLQHQARVDHEPGAIHAFLENLPEGTPVALETVGNWYWMADEIEAAGCVALLTHAAKAKVMMGNVNLSADRRARPISSTPKAWPSSCTSTVSPPSGCLQGRSATRGSLSAARQAPPHPDGALQAPDRPEEPHPRHPRQVRHHHR